MEKSIDELAAKALKVGQEAPPQFEQKATQQSRLDELAAEVLGTAKRVKKLFKTWSNTG